MGSLGALLLAVGYGADYSRRWALVLVQIYGVLATLFLLYLIVCGFTEYRRRPQRRRRRVVRHAVRRASC